MLRVVMVGSLLALAGCAGPSPQEQAKQDAAAVRMVERAQKQVAPPQPVMLEPIAFADVERHNLFGAGCNFVPGPLAKGKAPVVLADRSRAAIKRNGEVEVLSADIGGQKLPLGAWEHYVGKSHTLTVKITGKAISIEGEVTRYPGTAVLRDPPGRVVYTSDGAVDCGS